MKKRLLVLALTLCMALFLLPVAADAAEVVDSCYYSYSYDNYRVKKTWVLTSDGTLTISGEGTMFSGWLSHGNHSGYDFLGNPIHDPMSNYSLASQIKNVIIEDGVISIAGNAFRDCTGLINVTIPESVTTINAWAFYGCTSLTSVNIPSSVTTILDSAFNGCTSLASITIPVSVTSIPGYAFSGCTSLTSITIPASVEKLDYCAFFDCTNLKEVIFLGNSPFEIGTDLFKGVTATCYYPLGDPTWTPDIMRNYGGTITWEGYCPGHVAGEAVTENQVAATCTADGSYDTAAYCTICNEELSRSTTAVPALGHSWGEGVTIQEPTAAAPGVMRYTCTVCGETREEAIAFDSKYVRIYGNDRFQTAFKVADAMKEQLGVEKFTSVIIASGVNFADALSGSYLSAVKNAPILLSFNEVYNDQVKAYIRENMTDDGTIYILGGTGAVPASITTGLERYNIKCLAGDDRFGTNLAILEEAGVEGKDILVCTGLTFADSLSASASKLPILLVWRDLTKDQKAFLAEQEGSKLYVIGGEGAVSKKLETQVSAYGEVTRLAGGNRFETSTLIAETFFDAPTSVVLAYGWNFPDGLCGGGLAASMNAPLLLTMERYEAAATAYVQAKGIKNSMILGGNGLIPDASVRTIFALGEDAVITVK